MKLQFKTTFDQKIKTSILPYFQDEVDYAYILSISGVDIKNEFKGKFRSILLLFSTSGEEKYYLLGLGLSEKYNQQATDAFRFLAFKNQENWADNIAVDLRHLASEIAYHAALGLQLATYFPDELKSKPNPLIGSLSKLNIHLIHKEAAAKKWGTEGHLTGETQLNMLHLVNCPSNIKTPKYLADYAKKSGKANGFNVSILDKKELKKQGLHALLAVGQGAANEPVLIQMEYKPSNLKKAKHPQLGLVGKGITFDTGGISIKDASNMHFMKSDMGGAAAVIGAVELAAKLKLNIHLVGIVPSAENAIDANSMRPGDVIQSFSGKTIEVIDTDAEGRLVLADGLSYVQKHYQPEVLIDLATLTGSCVRTLGYTAAGLFSNNQQLSTTLQEVGTETHERVWPFPMWEDYDSDLSSDVADVKNFSGSPVAGAISAAKFLEVFIADHPKWAHLDIAGVAFGSSDYTKMKSATAYGIRLLLAYMKRIIGM